MQNSNHVNWIQFLKEAFAELSKYSFVHDLLNTNELRRLGTISFLGAINSVSELTPKNSGSRLAHTIFVSAFAASAAKYLSLPDRNAIVFAALVHDIGHGPFSHSTEMGFKERFGIDHHTIGISTLFSSKNIVSISRKYNIDLDLIFSLTFEKGKFNSFDIINRPINIDTIDGMLRCFGNKYNYFADSIGIDFPYLIENMFFIEDSYHKESDKFWNFKSYIYNNHINSPESIRQDELLRLYILESDIVSETDFRFDDKEFGSKHSRIFSEWLHNYCNRRATPDFGLRHRHFSIIKSAALRSPKDLWQRYKSMKGPGNDRATSEIREYN